MGRKLRPAAAPALRRGGRQALSSEEPRSGRLLLRRFDWLDGPLARCHRILGLALTDIFTGRRDRSPRRELTAATAETCTIRESRT